MMRAPRFKALKAFEVSTMNTKQQVKLSTSVVDEHEIPIDLPRRTRLLRFAPERLLDFCRGGKFEVVSEPFPMDVRVVHSFVDNHTRTLCIIVSSRDFAAVPEGRLIPEIDAPVLRRLDS
jgi:hypothetical protein